MKLDVETMFTMAIVVAVAAALVAFPYTSPVPIVPDVSHFKEIPRFESYGAMASAFEESGGRYHGGIIEEMATGLPMAMDMDSSTVQKNLGAGEGSSDYSETNIQVEGVDEADIVKTDGRHIYNFSGNSLIITDAYPLEGSKIVSKTELSNVQPTEMFVLEDKLLLFGSGHYGCMEPMNEDYTKPSEGAGVATEDVMSMPGCYGSSSVIVQLYDISDRSSPSLEKEIEYEGYYQTSRLIGSNAYFVVNSWPYYYGWDDSTEENIIPRMTEDGVEKRIAEAEEIGYILPMPAESFVTIASMNLKNSKTQKETIAGSAESVFASQDNIYLASTVWMPPETVIPDGTPVVKDVERIIIGDTEKTVINKFGLANGKIGYLGQGQVKGRVLNQFSMDEFEGNFRVATTIGWNGSNNLYVLDKEMSLIGSLEDLAPGESIYSARFMGKKAYLVTFKKVDPLFVIDVSDPTNPYVLGKLKIPGYSDYLHPIDETHLIGIGKDTVESTYGDFAWYQGVKMAIFDVSDVENPKEMHKIIIGDRGTDSHALHDHKAFLFDKEKELLVLPITLAEIPEENKGPLEERRSPTYGEYTFQGAFVFKVSLSEGFVERGRITHVSKEDELKRGYYFGDNYSVKRALYISDVLYTLSGKMLKANSLETLEGLKEFSFV